MDTETLAEKRRECCYLMEVLKEIRNVGHLLKVKKPEVGP